MTIVAIHQPEHFPGFGFFDKVARADIFVLLDNVQFSAGDFQNRARIKGPGGAQWLTVPVVHNFPQNINEVEISQGDWQSKHRRSLVSCYSKAKYFRDFARPFEELYSHRWDKLLDVNVAGLELIKRTFGIERNWVRSSSLELSGKKSDLVLNICKKLGASIYYSGRTGSTYLKVEEFDRAGIKIEVQSFKPPVYEQLFSQNIGFLPNLSVIDLLFNCGPQSLAFFAKNALSPPARLLAPLPR